MWIKILLCFPDIRTNSKKNVSWLRRHNHVGCPVCVQGGFRERVHADDDEWSVMTMSYTCPVSLYPGEGHSVWMKSGRQRLSLHVFLASCGPVQMWANTAECVLFWQPMVEHVNGRAEALHVSAVWGQGVSEMAGSAGLNTLTSAKSGWAPHYFNGKNPWSISESNLRPSCPDKQP